MSPPSLPSKNSRARGRDRCHTEGMSEALGRGGALEAGRRGRRPRERSLEVPLLPGSPGAPSPLPSFEIHWGGTSERAPYRGYGTLAL